MATSKLNHIAPVEFTLTNYDNRTEPYDSTHYTTAYVVGNIVVINIDCLITKTLTSSQTTLFTLPMEYIPKGSGVCIAFMDKGGTKSVIRVDVNKPNGNINFHHGGASRGNVLSCSFIYVI